MKARSSCTTTVTTINSHCWNNCWFQRNRNYTSSSLSTIATAAGAAGAKNVNTSRQSNNRLCTLPRNRRQQQSQLHKRVYLSTITTTLSTSINNQTGETQQQIPIQKQQQYYPIYVAATRQHVGKTTTSLALLNGLIDRFPLHRVGFMKPVGQQSVVVTVNDNNTDTEVTTTRDMMIDKDAALVKQYFYEQLLNISYEYISPVLIPKGYTRDYIDGNITCQTQYDQILHAYTQIQNQTDIVLCEGTGHVAVGSIVDASNAKIASLLNAKIVLVANGGLGNTFDELELNRNMCLQSNVDVAGVIINKVKPEKYDQTKEYLIKTFLQKWGHDTDNNNNNCTSPMLACIPDRPFLGCPALADLERLFHATVISGSQHRLRHYRIQDNLMLVATSLNVFLRTLRQNRLEKKRTLYICHASRNDILLGYLMESVQRNRQQYIKQQVHGHSSTTTTISINGDNSNSTTNNSNESFETAMIVTGCGDHPISAQVLEIVMNLPDTAPPVLMTDQQTDYVMQGIYKYTPKLNNEDSNRVERAVRHYQPYIDFDLLLDRVRIKE